MKFFVSDDGYRLFLSHGMWGDGDMLFHDVDGDPISFDGQKMSGTHIDVVVKSYQALWGKSCMNHGIAVEYNVRGDYWHPMTYVDDLNDGITEFMKAINAQGKDSCPEHYRLLGCACEGVVESPLILGGC